MDTTRLQRPARVRIESATTVPGTRVYIDDKDVTNDVVAVTWTVDANNRRPPTATITFIQADISGEAELAEPKPVPPIPGFASDRDRESFLAMFGDKLDDWFTPEFAAFVRRGPQPVVPREHVVPMGGSFRPISLAKPTGITADKQAPAGSPAAPQVAVDLRRTPDQWCAHYDVEIHNPDGWRHADAPPWDEPITLPDFWRRAAESTLRNVNSEGWRRCGRDAAGITAEQAVAIRSEIDFAEVQRYYDGTMLPPYPEPAGPVVARDHVVNRDEPTQGGNR